MRPEAPALTSLKEALVRFAFPDSGVQTSRHILALHWYVACRLVVEGGFDPDRIRPRPPITVKRSRHGTFLHHDPGAAKSGERTVLGGLKTKRLDVTVTIPTIGPVLAVSLKGSHNAFRNLTNRMEEAAGDCTNLHMAYPALVYAFWHVLRANEADDPAPVAHFRLKDGRYNAHDVALLSGGHLTEPLQRYRRALERLSRRSSRPPVALRGVRADVGGPRAQPPPCSDSGPCRCWPVNARRWVAALWRGHIPSTSTKTETGP